MTLDEKRKEWEKGLEPKMVLHVSEYTALVVLKGRRDGFDCYRYACFSGDSWDVSVDKQGADFETVLKWIEKHGNVDFT